MLRRLAIVLLLCLWTPPTTANADWLITPFLGTSFASQSTFLIFEEGAGRKLTLGASVSLLGDGIFGLEAEVAHTPRFFGGNDPLGLVLTSRVTTASGSVIVAAPLALTRESLRPYFVGGLGLMQARSKHAADLFPIDENLSAVNIGGGAIGFVTERTGLRFDVRHFRAFNTADNTADNPAARADASRLSFWRATAGVTIRY